MNQTAIIYLSYTDLRWFHHEKNIVTTRCFERIVFMQYFKQSKQIMKQSPGGVCQNGCSVAGALFNHART